MFESHIFSAVTTYLRNTAAGIKFVDLIDNQYCLVDYKSAS